MSQDNAQAAQSAVTQDVMQLDGNTAVLVIIGDPIAQVKAPAPLTRLLQQRGHNAVLVPMHVVADDVAPLMDTLLRVKNVAGVIATVPHKQLAASLLTELTRNAREANAVNLIRRQGGGWEGDLQDGTGFIAGLARNGFTVRGSAIAMAGAGGAGNAIAFTLGATGAADIAIRDVDLAKASALVERLKAAGYPARLWDGEPGPMQLVINATPIGMKPTDPLPIAAEVIHAGITVADVIMEPRTTRLLALAQDKGAKIVHGQHMMDEQLDAMVAFFAPAIRAVQGSH